MTLRERLEAIIENAIDLLDMLDGDCDLEHNGDLEPSLGVSIAVGGDGRVCWYGDDREHGDAPLTGRRVA